MNEVLKNRALKSIALSHDGEQITAFEHLDDDLIASILSESEKWSHAELARLNQSGDAEGTHFANGAIRTADGFGAAYQSMIAGGWTTLAFPEQFGGQALPVSLALCVMEDMHRTNMAFALCPMLSIGAAEAIIEHGDDFQKNVIAPKLVSGEWTGTMNLTEPQAGSDLSKVRTKAVPTDNGEYLLFGQKIFITWGDTDFAENTVHLVLARIEGAAPGSKGLSLFLCPKILVSEDGSLSNANAVRVIGIEHKLGIHASPTCAIEFEGAKAQLMGAPGQGLSTMFTMMNSARLNVGVQGVAVAEAAYQAAFAHAQDRRQGSTPTGKESVPIAQHPDVQVMLLRMRSKTVVARALCMRCARALDLAKWAHDETVRNAERLEADFLIPVAKAWATNAGVEVANIGVQVHGGLGYMNDSLASQLYRDARIAPIYEGTNGIQAIDLVKRKLQMSDGAAMYRLLSEVDQTCADLEHSGSESANMLSTRLAEGAQVMRKATTWLDRALEDNLDAALFGASSFLDLTGRVVGGMLISRMYLDARAEGSVEEKELKVAAIFFGEWELSACSALLSRITLGGELPVTDRATLFDD